MPNSHAAGFLCVDSMGDIEAAVKALKAGVDVLKVLRALAGARVVP